MCESECASVCVCACVRGGRVVGGEKGGGVSLGRGGGGYLSARCEILVKGLVLQSYTNNEQRQVHEKKKSKCHEKIVGRDM